MQMQLCAVVNKMTAATLRYRSVCEEDLVKVLNDKQIYTKTVDHFCILSIGLELACNGGS